MAENWVGPAVLLALAGGYLAGSVPFGLLLARLAGHGDIRRIGSGNIGATNVLRTGDKRLALATLLLDAGKGALPSLLAAAWVGEPAALAAGLGAVLGHNFPAWLNFCGGKGVATTLGVLLAIAWPVGLITIGVWIAAALLFRYSSLSALLALCSAPLTMLWLAGGPAALLAAVLAALALLRHHGNIRNLLTGREPKIGEKAPEHGRTRP